MLCTTCPSEGSCWLGFDGGGSIYDKECDLLVREIGPLKDCTALNINTQVPNEVRTQTHYDKSLLKPKLIISRN